MESEPEWLAPLVSVIQVEGAKPDPIRCEWVGCYLEATYYVRTKKLPPKPYCTEHSHGVAWAHQQHGHEEIKRIPVEA
jgi:hypothetical protein